MRRSLPALLGLALTATAGPAAAEDPAAPTPGPWAVVTVPEFTLRDETRAVDLPLIVVHPTLAPEGLDKRPVIVFSHGAGGQGRQVLDLPKFWASHGFVVLVPTHADSLARQRARGERGGMHKILEDVRGPYPTFLDRVHDVRFLLDQLPAIASRVPALRDRIDAAAIGVGGHSLGAWTAQVVGGARLDLSATETGRSLRDDRVKAVLLLSGQGPGRMGLTDTSWNDLGVPLLSVTGSRDTGAAQETPAWRKEPFLRALAGHKYHCFIEGAAHGSFTTAPRAARAERSPDDRPRRDGLPGPDPTEERTSLLGRLLGDPAQPLADLEPEAQRALTRRLARSLRWIEEREVRGLDDGVLEELRGLLRHCEAGEWDLADAVRAQLLARTNTTTGKAPTPAAIFGYTQSVTVRFWQAHLGGDASARGWLAGSDLQVASDGAASIERR